MENFDWTQFTKRIAIKAPMQTLYNAWAQSGELEKWFLKTALFKNENGSDLPAHTSALAGMSYVWTWYLYPETEYGKVLLANGADGRSIISKSLLFCIPACRSGLEDQ